MSIQIKKSTPSVGKLFCKKSGFEATYEWKTVSNLTPAIKEWIRFGEVIIRNPEGKNPEIDGSKGKGKPGK